MVLARKACLERLLVMAARGRAALIAALLDEAEECPWVSWFALLLILLAFALGLALGLGWHSATGRGFSSPPPPSPGRDRLVGYKRA